MLEGNAPAILYSGFLVTRVSRSCYQIDIHFRLTIAFPVYLSVQTRRVKIRNIVAVRNDYLRWRNVLSRPRALFSLSGTNFRQAREEVSWENSWNKERSIIGRAGVIPSGSRSRSDSIPRRFWNSWERNFLRAWRWLNTFFSRYHDDRTRSFPSLLFPGSFTEHVLQWFRGHRARKTVHDQLVGPCTNFLRKLASRLGFVKLYRGTQLLCFKADRAGVS